MIKCRQCCEREAGPEGDNFGIDFGPLCPECRFETHVDLIRAATGFSSEALLDLADIDDILALASARISSAAQRDPPTTDRHELIRRVLEDRRSS
jgi:hypothetical protein